MDDEARLDMATIALVRSGRLVDPLGRTADELEDAFRVEQLAERGFRTLAVPAGRTPEATVRLLDAQLLEPPLDPALERLAADDEFAARMRVLETRSARIEGERRALMAAHLQRVLDVEGDSALAVRELASLAAVELGVSTRGMERRITEAWQTVTELPAAHDAAAEGRITVSHLRVIEGETRALRLDPEVAADERDRVVAELVAVAQRSSPGQLRSRAKRVVDAVLAAPLQQRHDVARERRGVEVFDVGDGMCDVVARVPAVLAAGILDRLSQAARGKPKDDPRSFDQFRADALCELLLGGAVPDDLHGTSMLTAHVSVLIPATELLGDGEHGAAAGPALSFPASLDGRTLVDRSTARWLAGGSAVWERLFTDPVSGVAVTVDTYRPSAGQRRWLQARDGGCTFPGCACGSRRADLDHTLDWAKGGTTSIDNLATLCRSDHVLKHGSRWSMRQLAHGEIEWTTPIGEVVTTAPQRVGPTFAELRPPDPPRGSEPDADGPSVHAPPGAQDSVDWVTRGPRRSFAEAFPPGYLDELLGPERSARRPGV
ncbi:HNH endonuclease signature motif containing protein [Agrococcus sediminis]|nr:HNH endonuclease signature motif containing protein [Agrococcus sediminis]